MNADELKEIILKGEDTRTQFKEDITNPNQLAQELVAFSNSLGGMLIIGVSDDGTIKGLNDKDVQRLNQMISNVSSQNIKPPIYPTTDIVDYEGKKIMIVNVQYGINKPYCTNDGIYLTRCGADKRRIYSDEMRRLFQESGKLYADEILFKNSDWTDIDYEMFKEFYQKKYKEEVERREDLPKIFENLNLCTGNQFNLAGVLLFGKNVLKYFPPSQLICVSFFGNDITGTTYRDSENIGGNLKKLFTDGMAFINRNLRKLQNGKSFNSPGEPEIPLLVFEELLTNALIHRDYFISANIRIIIFDNRIEIISPGKLPNNLTVEKIKRGVSIKRNPTISSFAFDLLNYNKEIGSGILRALNKYPYIDFENDIEIEQFKAIIKRP